MTLRISSAHLSYVRQHLASRSDVETAAILLAEPHHTATGTTIVVCDAIPWPEDGYLDRQADHLRLDPIVMAKLLKPARERGLSVFTVHSHPGCDEAWFSLADDAGDSRLMASLSCQIPDVPHGSLVITGTGNLVARRFDAHGVAHPLVVVEVGTEVRFVTAIEVSVTGEREHRQMLALGPFGQACLRRIRLGIVGLGGLGAEVAKTMVHMGVGHITLMDGDVVETTNLPRIIGATMTDVAAKTPKVRVAQRYATSIGSPTTVNAVACHATEQSVEALWDCDLIIACVDRHTPRAILNRLSYRRLIPVIDTGVGFRVDGDGHLTGDAGRVVVVGPGRSCLACWGHISPDALRDEALTKAEREQLDEEGYISGASVTQPSVMCFNAMVAGAAVIEVLRLVCGFASDQSVSRIAFSFSRATSGRNTLTVNRQCHICRENTPPQQAQVHLLSGLNQPQS